MTTEKTTNNITNSKMADAADNAAPVKDTGASSHPKRGGGAMTGMYHRIEIALAGATAAEVYQVIQSLAARDVKAGLVTTLIDAKTNTRHAAIQGGAASVLTLEPHQYTLHHDSPLEKYEAMPVLQLCDLVLIAGKGEHETPKILFGVQDEFENVIATVGENKLPTAPNFETGDAAKLATFIHTWAEKQIVSMPLYSLVLAGGKSIRMQRDKGSIDYHGETQREHIAKLLAPHCEKVFVSCRAEQASFIEPNLTPLFDSFLGLGPAGGILTALQTFPNAAWLVVACDLPYLTAASVEHLISHRNPLKVATAFHNPIDGLPEPLLAIWEPKSIHAVFNLLALGYDCPRKVLINSRCEILAAPAPNALANVNTPAEFAAAREALSAKAL